MTDVKYGSLPFDAQIAFFNKKLALPTRAWSDIWQANHDHAFVVAGANKMALVEDFQTSIQKAIEKGTTLAEFRKDFDKIVAEHGWSYKGNRSWRTRVIYHTNLRSSYNAGRFEQLQRFPYWQYHHSISSENARPEHLAWDKLILPVNHRFWLTHYPQNGWGCNCWVTGISEARMKANGWNVSEAPTINMRKVALGKNGLNPRTVDVPEGISPGFAYAPGRSAWMHNHVAIPLDELPHGFDKMIPATAARDLLPEARAFGKDKILPMMQAGQEEDYARAFLQPFGADIGKPTVFTDVTGEAVVLSDTLFKKSDGAWKMGKRSRSSEIIMLAETLRHPDEVWVGMYWHSDKGLAKTSRVYISRYLVDGKQYLSLVVMGYDKGWLGITAHTSMSADDFSSKVERNRKGVRLFKRGA